MHKRYDVPTRIEGVVDPWSVDDDTLLVGKVLVPGVGLAVGLQLGGVAMIMAPAEAREMAKEFETGLGAKAGLGWVGTSLREAADEVEQSPGGGRMQ